MSFDDLFGLLVFALFVGVPVLNRVFGRRGGSAAPSRRPGRPTPQAPRRETPRPLAGDASRPAPAGTDDDLQRRLEEARRRVRETLAGRDAEGTAPEAPPAVPPHRPPPPRPEPVARPQPQRSAPRVRPERRPTPARAARLKRDAVLGLGPDDIMAGLIWHEVLSDPPSKRRIRRPSSRRR